MKFKLFLIFVDCNRHIQFDRILKAMAQKATHYFVKETTERKWKVINAEGKILGRLAVEIANALRGKDKAIFTPNQDCGDFVVVINSEKIKVTGDKANQKFHHRHSGHYGGHKMESHGNLLQRRPNEIIRRAVKGMLPHNRLSERLITKLKIYAGAEHPHEAQLAA
jgi:large subunit ribosomal protein L13